MIKLIVIGAILLACNNQTTQPTSVAISGETASTNNNMNVNPIHSFKVEKLDGGTIDFASFKGKKILIVNTASKCGYTKQYTDLQALYEQHKDKLVVIGFPANNFGGQEPGSAVEIQEFCQKNFGVTFPMAAKVSVKGANMAPIFKWLTSKDQNGVMDADIGWNFNKFLVDENGYLLAHFPSNVTPLSNDIVSKL
ncbi:MAG: glutathione peroxidase [Ferruginibacter sp.]